MDTRIRVNLSLNESDVELLTFFASKRGMTKSSYAAYLLRKSLDDEYNAYQYHKNFPDDILIV